MFKTRLKLQLPALVCGLLFIAGLVQLLVLRFESGDVYPAYSSLRSDPLGTQVLFESLGQVSPLPVQRNYTALDQADPDPQTTLVICGLFDHGRYLKHKFWQRLLDRLEAQGGRLVLGFTPGSQQKKRTQSLQGSRGSEREEPLGGNETDPLEEFIWEDELSEPSTPLENIWRGMNNFGLELVFSVEKPETHTAVRVFDGADQAPYEIPWPTPLYFDSLDDAWQVNYRWQDQPVIVSRPWGRGSLVMIADSYLFSNEALSKQREAGLLAWILAPDHRIIFDEAHHGLVNRPGIATLARKYRLHGVFACLVLLALMLIWRQAVVFVPPPEDDPMQGQSSAVGLNTQEGLVNLMRRHINSEQLLMVCFRAWRHSTGGRISDSKISRVETIIQGSADKDPALLYRNICNLLKEGKDL